VAIDSVSAPIEQLGFASFPHCAHQIILFELGFGSKQQCITSPIFIGEVHFVIPFFPPPFGRS